jgi:hypothetical protein
VDVGVAEARRLDADDDLTVARYRDGTILDDEWLTEIANDCGFHRCLLSRVAWC